MTRGINDGDIVFGGLELPQSNVDGNTTLALSLQFVQYPGVFERRLAKLSSLLLELLDGTLVNTTALVDQVTSGGGFAGIDVAVIGKEEQVKEEGSISYQRVSPGINTFIRREHA